MVTFTLNVKAVQWRVKAALIAVGAIGLAVLWCVLLALTGRLPGWLLPQPAASYILPLAMIACVGTVIGLLIRLVTLAWIPYRIALEEEGLWVGEAYYSYTDLLQVGVTAARPDRTQSHRLILRRVTGDTDTFRLGTWRAGRPGEVFAEYAQFVQMLSHTIERHPRPIELFLL